MPHAHHAGFQLWQVALTLSVVLMTLIYLRGWLRIRGLQPDAFGGWHCASFLVGACCIWLAVASPLAVLDHQLLTIHMVQHLLLMTIAAPLIWLGAPVKPLAHGLPHAFLQVAGSWFRSPSVQRLGRAITRPTVCWLAAAGTLVGWHIPPLIYARDAIRSVAWN